MNILILGGQGQVGSALVSILGKDYAIDTRTKDELDCADMQAVTNYCKLKPYHLIINAAAYTKVEQAEIDKESAKQLNTLLPKTLAAIARTNNCALIHYSTDYVFDGQGTGDYYEQSTPKPLNVYGATKWQGDLAILQAQITGYILRVAWVYGQSTHSFLSKIQKQMEQKKPLRIVRDQLGTPTSATFIAGITKQLIEQKHFPKLEVYNLSPKGTCSWYDFAKEYIQQQKITYPVNAITTDTLKQKVKRPPSVKLNTGKLEQLIKITFPTWKQVLKDYVHER